MSKPKRDYRFFENWARRNGMLPVTRVTDVEVDGEIVGDVLIADSDGLLAHHEFPNQEHDLPYFWRTGYAIDRGTEGTWIASFCDYPPSAFIEYGGDSRQGARLQDCMKNAHEMMKETHKVGLFNGNDRRIG